MISESFATYPNDHVLRFVHALLPPVLGSVVDGEVGIATTSKGSSFSVSPRHGDRRPADRK